MPHVNHAPKPAAARAIPAGPDPAVDPTTLSADDKELLSRSMRFLVSVQSPAFASRAGREGYSPEEHALGWSLWRTASGQDRPLGHWLSEQAALTLDLTAATLDKLRALDQFENTWFPRIRAIIQRIVAPDARDAFEAAFFQGLEQQPFGPSVVGSVEGLIARIESLRTTDHPDAASLRATLEQRGLTAGKLRELRAIIAEVQTGTARRTVPAGDPHAVLAGQREQAQAMGALRTWFNDWKTTLRSVFNSRESVSLGLTVLRRRAESDDLEDEASAAPAPAAPSPASG